MRAPDLHPAAGLAVPVLLDAVARVLWWGPLSDTDGAPDVVAVRDGRVLTWASAQDCRDDVRARGWVPEDVVPDDVLDLRPVAGWLARRRLALEPEAALNLWNLAGDVEASSGADRRDRGRRADRCHELLTIANVPWLTGRNVFRPRWSARDLTMLRDRLGRDAALLRRTLDG